MKTFINAARIVAVVLLFVSLTSLSADRCCPSKCQTRSRCETGCTTAPACRLKPQQVEIVKTCEHPGYYKQVCRLEYEPCEGKVERYKACPIYKGCFAEDGAPLDGAY